MSKLQQIIDKFTAINDGLKKSVNESSHMDMNKEQGTGLHISNNPKAPGRSTMGIMNAVGATKEAKTQAKSNLKELKSMPKPKLTKDEDAGDSMEMSEKIMPEVKEVHMHNEEVKGEPYDREVMKTDKNGQWSLDKAKMNNRNTTEAGVSDLGIETRRGDSKIPAHKVISNGYARVTTPERHMNTAKQIARENLADTKAQPKPKL